MMAERMDVNEVLAVMSDVETEEESMYSESSSDCGETETESSDESDDNREDNGESGGGSSDDSDNNGRNCGGRRAGRGVGSRGRCRAGSSAVTALSWTPIDTGMLSNF